MKNQLIILIIVLASLNVPTFAQEAIFGRPAIISPEVKTDNTVTFRVEAQNAKEVEVSGEWMALNGRVRESKKMTKDENGIWSYTTEALKSDLFDYSLLLCSTFHEMAISRNSPELENITVDKAKEMLKVKAGYAPGFGDKASEVYDAYAKAFHDAKPVEVMILAASNRKKVIETANAKIIQKAPVYVAWFGWEPPLFNNRMRAGHCNDIAFWFENTDLMVTQTGGGIRPGKLSDKMSDALLSFMRTGNPNCEALPKWPAYTIENGETMILNDVCEVKNDPDREARKSLSPN